MSDLQSAITSLDDSLPAHLEAEEYAEGRSPEVFTSGRMRRALKATGAKFRVNWCKTVITAVLNRLKVNTISCPDANAQTLVEAVWEANQLALEARSIHEAALTYGETFVIVWGDEDGVEIFHNRPTSVKVFYSPENPRLATHAIKRWTENDGRQRINLYYPDRIERYITVNKASSPKASDFVEFVEAEGDDWPTVNPYNRLPVFHFRTEFPAGRPEHKEAYGPQDILNKLTVSQMSTADFQAFPQRYALTESGLSDGSAAADEDFGDDDESDAPDLEGGAGNVWWLDGVKSVGTLPAADPKVFLEPIQAYVAAMASTTSTPNWLFEGGSQQPSGESRRMAAKPFTDKVGDRQLSFGATWKEIFKFALLILGQNSEGLQVSWDSAESDDDLDGWEKAKKQVEVGVPLRQVLLERGYTATEIDGWTQAAAPNTQELPPTAA